MIKMSFVRGISLGAALWALPGIAVAQQSVQPGFAPKVVAEADDNRRGYGGERREQTLSGEVAWFRPYHVGLIRGPQVYLHNGTVINPTGIELRPHMRVTIYGRWTNDGNGFVADRIDVTPWNGAYGRSGYGDYGRNDNGNDGRGYGGNDR